MNKIQIQTKKHFRYYETSDKILFEEIQDVYNFLSEFWQLKNWNRIEASGKFRTKQQPRQNECIKIFLKKNR